MAKAVRLAQTVASITPTALKEHLASKPTALKLTGLAAEWPALKSWRLDDGLAAIRQAAGENREVEVELGRKGRGYLDQGYQRVPMGLGLFLDAFILNRIPSSSAEIPSGYLAQSDLMDVPEITRSVALLPHCNSGPQSTFYRRTMWIGPAGSFTPFHRDPYIGIYTHLIGKKRFFVLPPEAAAELELSPEPRHKNTSTIPLPVSRLLASEAPSEPDIPYQTLERYRRVLKDLSEQPGACQAELGPGDSLLVPEGWWHSAEGEDGPGVGVNAWFR